MHPDVLDVDQILDGADVDVLHAPRLSIESTRTPESHSYANTAVQTPGSA